MIDLQSYALQAHNWFIPKGTNFTVPGAGVVALDALPGPTDPLWPNSFMGDTEGFEDTRSEETTIIKKPVLGQLVRKRTIQHYQSLDFKLVTNSMSRLAFQIMYGSAIDLTVDVGEFVPMAAAAPEGWFKTQRYTDENELVFAADLWVRLTVTGGMKGGGNDVIKPEFKIEVLASDLNTMFFGDPSLLD